MSRTLLADLPELGTLDRKQIAALSGLAPFNRDSGQKRGTRAIWGSRANVRSALYMATLTAIRWNPASRDRYQRFVAAGKHKKVALIACTRKLLAPCPRRAGLPGLAMYLRNAGLVCDSG